MKIDENQHGRQPQVLAIGEIVKTHGLRGELKVRLYNPKSTALHECSLVILQQGTNQRRVEIKLRRQNADGLAIVAISGIAKIDDAYPLCGSQILVERVDLAPLSQNEYFYNDLIGCNAVDEHGRSIGAIVEIRNHGASDILVVQNEEWERLIPFVDDWVIEVDMERREIKLADVEQWEPHRR